MKRVTSLLLCLCVFVSSPIGAKPFEFLAHITNAFGPSGFENDVAKLVINELKPHVNSMKKDGMGNVVARLKSSHSQSKLNTTRVLLMAHMDEVGFIIRDITKEGLALVEPLGGLDDNVVFGQHYQIKTAKGLIDAYSGVEAIHIIPKDKRNQLDKKERLFLDFGASSKAEAINQFGVRPGLPVTFKSQFTQLSAHRYLGKALDDRVGVSLLSDVAKAKLNTANDVYLAFTTQEEEGLRGAKVVYPQVKPDVVFNIEIGIASDFPLHQGTKSSDIRLGKGVSIFVYDRSMIPNQALTEWVLKVAKDNNIAIQYELEPGYGEDGASLQTQGQGVPTINIGIPVRYAHQSGGIFDAQDYKNALKLIKVLVSNIDKKGLNV